MVQSILGGGTSWRLAASTTAELENRETAWVYEGVLRNWPELGVDQSTWQSGLDAMSAYAKGCGWVDQARQGIMAHVEWVAGSKVGEGETTHARQVI
jgi:hypothetical protein